MNIIDIVTIVVLVLALVLGLARGFGKSLKTFTSGIFGIIISVFVCFAFGGVIAKIDVVVEFIANINTKIGDASQFLGKLKLGIWVYYLALFVVVQILRILTVKVICEIFEKDNKVMKFLNKFLGAVFAPAAVCMFVLLVLAAFKLFDDVGFVQNILAKLDDTILLKIYANNPILFLK